MFQVSIKWLWIFVIFTLCEGTNRKKPELFPAYTEHQIHEEEELKLTCTGIGRLKFFYPEELQTTSVEIFNENVGTTQRIVLKQSNASYDNTGWYGCGYEDSDVIPGFYNESDVAWTYVYVKSNTSYFIKSDTFESLRVTLGSIATIPCRPTSPDYEVLLFCNLESGDKQLNIGPDVSYDPRIGFKVKGLTVTDSNYYACVIKREDNETEVVHYHISVRRKHDLKKPKIIKDTLRHVTRGQTLRVNCTIEVDADIQYVCNWTRQGERTMMHHYWEIISGKRIATCELTIYNVTDEDGGDYECSIAIYNDSKMSKTTITVYDPEIKYINLKTESDSRFFQKSYGDSVQWVVEVDAYPSPVLKWLDPKGDEILASWLEPDKRVIKLSPVSTILRINRLDLDDIGLYSLQASNGDQIKTLNFTLEVKAKPLLFLHVPEAFYMVHHDIITPCQVAAFPAPDISWSFLEEPYDPPPDDTRTAVPVSSEFVKVIEKSSSSFVSVLTMPAEVSGIVSCTACNELGCDSVSQRLFVTDVPAGFGILESNSELTEGDELTVTCAASIYNYTGVEWVDKDDNRIVENDRIKISNGKTAFTHRSDLYVKNVRKSDNGTQYSCNGLEHDGFVERSEFKFRIYDPEAPYFTETNINKTEMIVDLSSEGHKAIVFKCYASGMPTPNVTWYKDGIRIRNNEQYMCLHNNQELYIKYLVDGNSGKYVCKVENRFGKLTNFQIITLKEKEESKILIIAMSVLAIFFAALVAYFVVKMRREKAMRKQLMEAGLTHFEEGALECLNPDLTVDDQAELLPYDKKWEFPRENLKFGKQLGCGAFGVVMKAEARGILEEEAVTTVAVKMVRRTTESTYIKALASELKIMVHLGKHINVVNLLGACTKNITKRELLVIVEYCRFGNLHNYLFRHRADFINQIDPVTGNLDTTIGCNILARSCSQGSNNSLNMRSSSSNTDAERVSYTNGIDMQSIGTSPDGCILSNNSTQPGWRSNYRGDYKDQNLKPICTQDLLSWAFQVARGMEYLSQRKVLHGDLAARNILLAENNIVKICDFGLAKTMYKDDNYKKKGDAPLPIKWMAIESIRDRVFSTQSDIWSFGIVLWEFFTLAKTPYPGMEAEKQYQKLIEGYRMEQPEYATEKVYDIMLKCWKAKPTLRPTFTNLVTSIGDLLEESIKEHYMDLNAPYLAMNTMAEQNGKSDYLTMMSAPDHEALSSPVSDYVNSPFRDSTLDDSYLPMSSLSHEGEPELLRLRQHSDSDNLKIPINDVHGNSDSETDPVEISPMLIEDSNNYVKPISVEERRARFAKQRQAMMSAAKKEAEGNEPRYCNTPRNHLIDLNDTVDGRNMVDRVKNAEPKSYAPSIGKIEGHYVNLPKSKSDQDEQNSFSNPSYTMISHPTFEQTGM